MGNIIANFVAHGLTVSDCNPISVTRGMCISSYRGTILYPFRYLNVNERVREVASYIGREVVFFVLILLHVRFSDFD